MIHWVPVYNADTEAVPPFGVMQSADLGVNSSGQLQIQRPTVNGATDILFNGPSPIPPGKGGQGNETFPAIAAYDQAWDTDSTDPLSLISIGDILGAKAGSWFLAKNYAGFRTLDTANGVANVTRDTRVFDFYDPNAWYPGEGSIPGQNIPTSAAVDIIQANDCVRGFVSRVITAIGIIVHTVTGATTPKVRLGVYRSLSNRDLAPSKLLYDSGDITLAGTDVYCKKQGLAINCPAGYVYWYVSIFTFGGTAPVVCCSDDSVYWAGGILGSPDFYALTRDNSVPRQVQQANFNDYYRKPMAYGALPDPAGMTLIDEDVEFGGTVPLEEVHPNVFVKYA